MKILVFGLGALGTVYSCLLKEQGHYVVGVDRDEVVRTVAEHGVQVSGIWGTHAQSLDNLVSSLEDLDERDFDLVILTVKSYDTADVASQIAGFISPAAYTLLAQNGYGNFEAASQHIDPARLIVGRVIFGAETLGAGESRVTVIADDVIIGSPGNLIDTGVLERISQTCDEAGIPTRTSSEVMKYVWGKIIYNSALNPLGAILEVPYGRLADDPHARQLMDDIIDEIFAVLHACGQDTLWAEAATYKQVFYGQLIPTTALHHASMLQDIQRGRKTEIDALNGAVVRLGRQCGIATPVNEVVAALIRAKESMRG
ncbi:MAG TPA: ketopantoate reductase family protein [Syntrophomonadaceae bacterium]|nr:ketopantoate reductase family protein [Syntrophomonadaceae bacterium]